MPFLNAQMKENITS